MAAQVQLPANAIQRLEELSEARRALLVDDPHDDKTVTTVDHRGLAVREHHTQLVA